MTNSFSFDKSSFIEHILDPISKVQDSFSLILENNQCKVICENPNFKLRTKGPISYEGEELKLHFADIKKFLRALKFLKDDKPVFEFDKEKLIYKNKDGTKFLYHLIDGMVAKKSSYNEEKVASLKYDVEFLLTESNIKQIISAAAISNIEEKKVYFYTENEKIFAEINDKSQSKVDSISFMVSNNFTGTNLSPTSISFDLIRNLNGSDIKVKASRQFFNFEKLGEYQYNLLATSYTK